MMKKMQSDDMKSNPFAGLGMMLAGSMVNGLVDNLVTAESLANMISKGRPKVEAKAEEPTAPAASVSAEAKAPKIVSGYEGLGIFKVEMRDPEKDKPLATLVLYRDGWFGWKLKTVRLNYMDDI